MGLWEFLQQWRGSRATAGITVSLLLHALVVAAVLWGARLPVAERWRAKPGDALIVELPDSKESASAGTPDAPAGPVTPQAPPNPAKSPPPSPRPAPARPAPPARPEAPAPRQVAAAPRPAEPARPAPRPVETPQAAPPRSAEPPADTGAEKAPQSTESTADAATPKSEPTTPKVDRVPTREEANSQQGGGAQSGPQVASVPPGGAPGGPALPDIRSALRRGAGGRGEGRGGILGEPIPLDSSDPRFSDFLNQVRRQIQAKLNYPCIKHPGNFECEPKDTEVIVHFGILKNGRLQFVELWVASPWSIYDDSSMTAIRLAQPFPPVPAAMMASLPPGSTGVPIAGRFRFQVTYSTLVR